MQKIILLYLVLVLSAMGLSGQAQSASKKVFKHIVTVTFTDNASPREISEVDQSFKGLSTLKVVKAYEWGIAPITDRNKEIKHTYAFSFASLEDLDVYTRSPEHQKHMNVGVSVTKKGRSCAVLC